MREFQLKMGEILLVVLTSRFLFVPHESLCDVLPARRAPEEAGAGQSVHLVPDGGPQLIEEKVAPLYDRGTHLLVRPVQVLVVLQEKGDRCHKHILALTMLRLLSSKAPR